MDNTDMVFIVLLLVVGVYLLGFIHRAGKITADFIHQKARITQLRRMAVDIEKISAACLKNSKETQKAVSQAVRLVQSNKVVILSVDGKAYRIASRTSVVDIVGKA